MFERDYYLQNYSEVINSGTDPITHYLKTGWHHGNNPSPNFITEYYLTQYPDVLESGINPLVHYIRFGKDEGRIINPSEGAKYKGYLNWVQKYDTLTEKDQFLIQTHINSFKNHPKFIIIITITEQNIIDNWIKDSISSVINQIYTHWQLIILCDQEKKYLLDQTLLDFNIENNKINFFYYNQLEDLPISINKILENHPGDYFSCINAYDILRPHALYLAAHNINLFPDVSVIYSDEDQIDEEYNRCNPFFKPDWNPDLILSVNFLLNFTVYKKMMVKKVGGYQKELDKDINWDLALRITQSLPRSNILHIPHICIHGHLHKKKQQKIEFITLASHFDTLEKDIKLIETDNPYWHVRYPIPYPNPLVSIIIPTKNQLYLLKNCLESISNKTTYQHYEILVINNQTTDPDALAYFTNIGGKKTIHILDYDDTFNYSAINNDAVKRAMGEILVFLNDDIEVISPDWLEELIGHALREEIGAVGAMLYFPNDTIQHAGIILYPDRIAGHAFYSQARGSHGQNDRARLVQNYSAVTGACMAVKKSKFQQVGGFDEENLAIAYNDVDLCLKLKQAGYENLWTPYAELYHHESVSRGLDDTKEKQNRLKRETDFMNRKWGSIITHDPAYNPNLKSNPFFSLAKPPRFVKPWKSHNTSEPQIEN